MLTVIYTLGALAIGFLAGIVTETFIDAEQVRSLNNKIDRLKVENQALIDGHTEVIEVVDNREDDNPYHDYFKPF